MTEKGSFKRHFAAKNLKPFHEAPIVFVISQWQCNKTEPGILFLIYRTAVAAFLLTTWGMSFTMTSAWAIYLTNWGYTLATAQSVLAFILSFATVMSKAFTARNIHDNFLKVYPLYWILHQTAVPIGFMITIIFWTLLWSDEFPFTALNFFVHGSNSIVLFVDLLIIGHPIRLLHFIYPFLFGMIYAVFSVIYYFIDINRGGTGYVYYILDWNYPFQTILVVLGVTVLVLLLHAIAFGIHVIKVMVHNKLYPESIPAKNTQSTENIADYYSYM